MKYLKYFEEKYEPLKGEADFSVDGQTASGKVEDIIKFAEKYKVEKIKLTELYDLGLWHNEDAETKINGKWIKVSSLSTTEREKYDKQVQKDINKVDLQHPIIVTINKKDKITSILDGNHRLEKAYQKNLKTIKAYKIPEKDFLDEFKNNEKDNI